MFAKTTETSDDGFPCYTGHRPRIRREIWWGRLMSQLRRLGGLVLSSLMMKERWRDDRWDGTMKED